MNYNHISVSLIIFFIIVIGSVVGNAKILNFHKSNKISLLSAIDRISKEYEVYFTFDMNLVSDVEVEYHDKTYSSAEEAISHILKDTELKYKFYDQRFVILYQADAQGLESLKKMSRHLDGLISEGEETITSSLRKVAAPIPMLPNRIRNKTIKKITFAVEGKVVDEEGEPLIGVNIQVKGSNKGTSTDLDGTFILEDIDENTILLISYIGYQSKEVSVAGKSRIEIVMSADSQILDEVVVVGYGTQRKSDLTGSVSSIQARDIPMTSVTSVGHALQGKAAGLIVMQNSAQPGGGLDILIRGESSINAGNNPLYIVDGFPISQLDQPAASSTDSRLSIGTQGPLNFLNPNDIASIEILKDASATAIYGSKAANGVIIITTHRGIQGKPEIDYTTTFGVQEYLDKWDTFKDLGEWMQEINNAAYESWLSNRGVYPYGGNPNGEERVTVEQAHQETDGTVDQWINEYDENGNIIRGSQPFGEQQINNNLGIKGSDWINKLTRQGIIQQHNLSIRGGTPVTRYMASLNYLNHEGIVKNSGIRRYSGRLNFDQEFGEKIRAQITLLGSNTNNDNISHGDTQFENTGLIRSAIEFNPDVPYINPDGTYPVNQIVGNRPNPLSLLHVTDNTETNRLLANTSITFEPTKDLFLKFSSGLDLSYSKRGNYFPKETLHGDQYGGDARLWNRYNKNNINEITATYNITKNDNHKLTILGGYIFEKSNSNNSNLANTDFIIDGFLWNNLSSGSGTRIVGSGASENIIASYLGRINYILMDKYLLTATFRRDGSSRFAKNKKWGTFPSIAIGWNMSEENFMKSIQKHVKTLKWRISWGQTGNDNIGGRHNPTYSTIQGWTRPSSGSYTAVIPSRVENPDLKWETTTEFNFGLDLEFEKLNRLTASFEYYTRKIEDLLQQRTTASYQYLNSVWANVGATQNQGVEITLNTKNIIRRDLTWTTDFTFTKYEDKWLRRDSEWTPNIWEKEKDYLRPIYTHKAIGILQKNDQIPLHHLTPEYGGTGTSNLYPGGIIIADMNGPLLDENGNPQVDENGKVILSGEPDGKIDDADRIFIGTRDPGYIIGLTNKFTYKSFDLNLYMYGMFDRILEDPTFRTWGRSPGNMVSQHLNGLRSIKNRWMDETIFYDREESKSHARSGSGDWYYENAWFIRAQSISIGYTIPQLHNIFQFFSSSRIYLDIQNAFVITPYGGNDPETDRYAASYPNARTFTLGLNLSL